MFLKYFNQLFPVVYLTVLAGLFIVRIIGLSRVFQLIRQNTHKKYAGYYLIESSISNGAFSFLRYVFIPQKLNEIDKQIILKHENAHIEQFHWIDLFFTDLLCLIWWFNPIIWLYGKAIRNNHEFLADKDVLNVYNTEDYMHTLLKQWFKTPLHPMTNSFAYINYLKRIKMMKKNMSNPFKKLFALCAIPAIAIFLLAFSEKEFVIIEPLTVQHENEIVESETVRFIEPQQPEEVKPSNTIPVQEDTLRIRNTGNQQLGEVKPLVLVDGKEVPSINVINPDMIESVSVLKNESSTAIYGTRGKNGVILITTKRGMNLSQEPVRVGNVLGETIQISGTVINAKDRQPIPGVAVVVKGSHSGSVTDMNGNYLVTAPADATLQFSYVGMATLEIVAGNRQVIDVVMSEDADDKIVVTTTVGYNGNIRIISIKPDQPDTSGQPLYIVDGKEVSTMNDLKPEDIESISVLKDARANSVYGEKGKNGVVLITTKKKSE